jgi:MYXO-CTERM domain-containing protein
VHVNKLATALATLIVSVSSARAEIPAADGPGGIAAVKEWARKRVTQAQGEFTGGRLASPGSWADAVVYQIQVDRFNDGDPSNNRGNITAFQRDHEGADNRRIDDYVHGGDLAGITQRLDYLADLGVSALWITPILRHNGSYHGYCTADFTEIDPGFGTARELRELTVEAHKRGIRVVLDIVVNHMCSNDTAYAAATPFTDAGYDRCVDDLNQKRWTGPQSVRGQRQLAFGPAFFPAFRNQNFFSRCGFRPNDFSTQGNGALFGDFSDAMFDFDTMNWDFQDIFTELHKYWIAYADVDGFRMDAAKHVSEDFIAKFSTEVRAYAASLGKRDFFLIGEVAASPEDQARRLGKMRANHFDPGDRSANIAQTLRDRLVGLKDTYLAHDRFPFPGANAVYDFTHSGGMVDVMHQSRAPLAIKQWFWAGGEADHDRCADGFCELVANGQPLIDWNMIEIHDWPRFAQSEFGGDRGRAKAQLSTALGYLLAAPGAPILYYGVEQGFDGNCGSAIGGMSGEAAAEIQGICKSFEHTRYRQDMFVTGPFRLGSVVDPIRNLGHIGADQPGPRPASWTTDPMLDRSHDLYRWVRRLVAIRKSCTALRRGETYFRAAHGAPGGLLAFSRIDGDQELMVLVNTGDAAIPVSQLFVDAGIHRGHDFERWRNLMNGFETASLGVLGGGMGLYFANGFTMRPHSVAIFAPERKTTGWNGELEAHLCTDPKFDAEEPAADDGGCSIGTTGGGSAVPLAALLLVVARRRRRR